MANITLTQEQYALLMELAAKGREARYEIKRLCTLARPLTRWDFDAPVFGQFFGLLDMTKDIEAKPVEPVDMLINQVRTRNADADKSGTRTTPKRSKRSPA